MGALSGVSAGRAELPAVVAGRAELPRLARALPVAAAGHPGLRRRGEGRLMALLFVVVAGRAELRRPGRAV